MNKNALVRYLAIDQCLRTHHYGCTLEELILACSDKLNELTGHDDLISGSTIRHDLSDIRRIFGPGVPLINENGRYRYTDPGYRLLANNIIRTDLLRDILNLLLNILDNLHSPDLQVILARNYWTIVDLINEIRRTLLEAKGRKSNAPIRRIFPHNPDDTQSMVS